MIKVLPIWRLLSPCTISACGSLGVTDLGSINSGSSPCPGPPAWLCKKQRCSDPGTRSVVITMCCRLATGDWLSRGHDHLQMTTPSSPPFALRLWHFRDKVLGLEKSRGLAWKVHPHFYLECPLPLPGAAEPLWTPPEPLLLSSLLSALPLDLVKITFPLNLLAHPEKKGGLGCSLASPPRLSP